MKLRPRVQSKLHFFKVRLGNVNKEQTHSSPYKGKVE